MRKTYLDNKNKKLCNGCGVCSKVCPENCIKMVEDEEGFLYPLINKEECIQCGKCVKICSNINDKQEKTEKAYAAINSSKKHLDVRSSGGMFMILAQYVIDKGGVVFGAFYTKKLEVKHGYAENIKEVIKFSGSKYVRSNLDDSYFEVKHFLENNRYVLFTGTPCQVNGLKKYLNKDYEKLILCDIVCHANPSPKVFKMFIKNLENKKNNKVININFRGKECGWKEKNTIIQYENGEKKIEKTFMKAFDAELINRPSCYSCPFANKRRISDITIGDFWGVEKIVPEFSKICGGGDIVSNY